ncbi:MAG: sugar transferase [Pseudomonadota bacterium]|nr:sugar transferase [Pseudomonadota bacterium]
MKRIFDITLSAGLILVLLPLFLPLATLLRLTGEGKVFYRQKRIGAGQQPFEILKFATMLENSPIIGTGDITLRNDPRVLRVGRVLRKTKINELPQLWNVLVGDMSIVGPRPLTPNHFNHYNDTDRENIAVVTPGITGLSALVFRDEEKILSDRADPVAFYRDEIVPIKASLETWYATHASFRLDILIGLLTAYAILRPGSRLVRHKVETISGIKFPF